MARNYSQHSRRHDAKGTDPIPGPWADATLEAGLSTPTGFRALRYRDSGLGGIDLEGVVDGATPPQLVTTLDSSTVEPPDASILIPGTGGHDWQLDPDLKLWIIT